jgi:flagellar biosynthetic protein FliO
VVKEFFSLLGALIMIVLVLFATYYFTKAISKKMTASSSSRHLKIIDRVVLSQNKFLIIVEVDKKFLLVGVSDNNISVLKEFDSLSMELDEENSIMGFNANSHFLEILKHSIMKTKLGSKFMKDDNNIKEDKNETVEKDDKDGEA